LKANNITYIFNEVETVPPILQGSYFPSLNGIRGIAILMVVVDHLKLSSNTYYHAVFNGRAGVLIFFVLSGFLITTLCLKEKVITKDISLKNFYIRRALRILPVAFLYLIAIVILNLVFKLDVSYISVLGAAFFLMDFTSIFRRYYFSWYTGHYWSLAVEEQFYLVVPFILKKHFKAYIYLLLFLVFVLPVIFCLQYFYPRLNTGVLYAISHFLIKFLPIAVGCLFSVFLFKYPIKLKLNTVVKVLTNLGAFVLIILIRYDDFVSLQSIFSSLLISVLTGYLIISNLPVANDVIYKLLNSKIFATLGILSYSIYIWQQLFTSYNSHLPAFMSTWPANLICIVLISCASYYLYESYFLRLKTKYAKIKTTNSISS
jgi:peptidoglycan/LPS O-acetylase OafA/YrhL